MSYGDVFSLSELLLTLVSLQVILFLTHLKSLIPEAKTPCRDTPQVSSIYKRWMGMSMLAPFRHVSGCIFKNVRRDTFPRKPSISSRGLESHWCGRAGRERSRSSVMSSNKQARNCVNALIILRAIDNQSDATGLYTLYDLRLSVIRWTKFWA